MPRQLFLFFCIGLLFFVGSVTATTLDKDVRLTNEHKTVIVSRTDQRFTINLASNRTTGYTWRLKNYDPRLVSLVRQRYYVPQDGMPGAGGVQNFVFKILPTFKTYRTTQITFVYVRPWNNDIAKTVTFRIRGGH